jgi:hypothetical protein
VTPPAAAAPATRSEGAGRRPRLTPGVSPARAGGPGLAPAGGPGIGRSPRRVSGPARRAAPARALGWRSVRPGALLLQLVATLERLSSHRLLDRLIRGRAWIGLVTFALIGIVTLQLALLKLNGTVGRTLESEARLQRENASLSIENSEVAAADRVQARAGQMGMEFTSSRALRFLTANPHLDFTRGAAALNARASSGGAGEGGAGRAAPATASEGGSSEGGGGEARASESSGSTAAGGSSESSSAASEGSSAPSSSAPAGGEAGATPPQAGQGEPSSAQASPAGGSEAGPSG